MYPEANIWMIGLAFVPWILSFQPSDLDLRTFFGRVVGVPGRCHFWSTCRRIRGTGGENGRRTLASSLTCMLSLLTHPKLS